jgi:hypothetical protein
MLHSKKLAFRNKETKKPIKRKRLFFCTAALTVVFGCSSAANASDSTSLSTRTLKESIQQKKCNPDIERWLGPTEKVIEIICQENYEFVLTNANLLTITKYERENPQNTVSLNSTLSRTSMRNLLKAGYIDWTTSENTVFVLTSDGMLTLVPAEKKVDMWDVWLGIKNYSIFTNNKR